MYCDEERKNHILFLFIVTIYLFHLCGSVPPTPRGSRISAHKAHDDSSLTERGGAKHDVPKGNLDELLVQGRKMHESSKSAYNKFWSQAEASGEDSSTSKPNEPAPQKSLSWTWTKGKAIRSQSLSDAEDGFQSDFTGFSGVPGKVLVSSSDWVPHASEWLAMKPVLLCDQNFMSFTASGQGFSQLLVDKGRASPVSLLHLALYCGYTVRTSWSDLQMTVPYDACYITQENGSYVLPMLWWGNPLKLSCPVHTPTTASSIPDVLCSPYGMALHLHQQENNLPVLGVLVNGGWAPFVSAECAYRVDSQPEELILFVPFFAPCLGEGLKLKIVFDEQEMILSCSSSPGHPHVPYINNPSTPPPSSAQEPIAQFPDYHHATDTGLPNPQIPQLSSPDITPWFSPASPPEAPPPHFPYPSTAGPSAQDPIAQLPGHPHLTYPGSIIPPTLPHVDRPGSQAAIPWFSPASSPAAPGVSTQDQIAQHPHYHPHPHMTYPGFLSPTFPQVYPPGSKPVSAPHLSQDSEPGTLRHPFQYPQNPIPPSTQNQMSQSPDNSRRIYSHFPSPHFDQISPPASEPASQPAAPQAPHPPTILDYLQMPSSPPKQPPRPHYQLPSHAYDYNNPYEASFYEDHNPLPASAPAFPSYPFPHEPIFFREEHQQANCHPHAGALCGAYQYPSPYNYPTYSPIHPPDPQHLTEPPAPTQKPAPGKTSISPLVIPKPKVFCSSNQMRVHFPPGPISGIVVKDAQGKEMSVQDAPKHCGYSASVGKDGNIHFSLQLHTRCHMSVQDNMFFISVIYVTQSGKMEARFYCPGATSSSGQDCDLPRDQRLPCEQGPLSRASCLSMGCCFSKHPPACYYRMDECTVDRHFVFSVPASLTEPPLSPALLGVANNSTCKPVKVTYDYALFKIPMDGCGARRMEVGKTLIYMVEVVNTVQTISLNYGSITRDSPVRLLVECRFVPGSALTVSYLVKTPTLGPAVQTQGVFGVQLRLAKDAQYTSYYPQYHQPLQMLLGKPLYLEVRMLNAPDPNLKLLVHYCVAYSRSGSSVWVLLYNGCPNPLDPTSQVVLSDPQAPSPHAQIRRFTMSTFQFLPEGDIKDLNEEVDFMCSTEICSTLNGPCVEGCFGH
ncbi:uncharacterized protein LOC144054604 [Vanacampus margaritifer]